MITFPCAKINLGLNIVSKREDGYHNLETVFYPIPLTDALEIKLMDEKFPSDTNCDLKITGDAIDCNEKENLVIKAYDLLAENYTLPRLHAHLYKHIPSQAGLGGGSSDAAYMLRLLNERFKLNIGYEEMKQYAARLGADCPFFITSRLSYATGIGDNLIPMDTQECKLHGCHIAIVKPNIAVSTKEAFAFVTPCKPEKCCKDIVRQPVETWREELGNDFEHSVFTRHPLLKDIKQQLYDLGAVYAQMSGSGSSLFGIFKKKPKIPKETFKKSFVFISNTLTQ